MTTMWDHNAEAMSTDERANLQSKRLAALVGRLVETSPFYRRRLGEHGVEPGAEVGLDDLTALPFTLKSDLWDNYPWEMLTIPRKEVVRVHASSGTGGRPTLVGYSRADLAMWAEMNARALGCAGAGPGTVVHVAYGYGLFTGGLGLHGGAELMGCTVLPASSGQSARQVVLLRDLGELRLRAGVLGAEPWTEAMRVKIEGLLGLKALDIYGLSEIIGPGVACESLDSGGMLNVAEDHFYVEAVDTEGNPVPDGTPGELVFSTLTKTGMPLLRYRSGDVATLDGPAEGSPRTLRRMSKLLGRRDDMLVVRGVNVFPTEIEAVLLADARVSPHYLIVEDRRVAARPELRVAVEPFHDAVDTLALQSDLAHALRERL